MTEQTAGASQSSGSSRGALERVTDHVNRLVETDLKLPGAPGL